MVGVCVDSGSDGITSAFGGLAIEIDRDVSMVT